MSSRFEASVKQVARSRVVRYGLVAGAIGLAFSVQQRLELALQAAHGAGDVPGGVGTIANPARLMSPELAVQVTRGWHRFDLLPKDRYQTHAPATAQLTTVYLIADLLLMAAVVTLLLLLQRRARRLAEDIGDTGDTMLAGQRAALRGSWPATWVYLAADLVETERATQHWLGLSEAGARFIAGISALKWLALALAVLPLAIDEARRRYARLTASTSTSVLLQAPVPAGYGLLRALRHLRGQLLVVALLIAVLLALKDDLGLQVDDVLIRASEEEHFLHVLLALIATALVAATLAIGGWWCAHAYLDAPPVRPIGRRWLGALAAGSIAVAGTGFWPGLGPQDWAATRHVAGLVGVGVLLFTVTSSYRSVRSLSIDSVTAGVAVQAALRSELRALLPALAVAPFGVLALAVIRAAVSQWAAGSFPRGLLVWTVLIVALMPVVLLVVWVYLPRLRAHPRTWILWAAMATGLLVPVAAFLFPIGWAAAVGTTAVLMAFAAWLAVVVSALVGLGDRVPVRGAPALLGVRRWPLVGLVALLGVAASLADQDGVYFDVVGPVALGTNQAPLLPADAETLMQQWLRVNAHAPQGAGRRTTTTVPRTAEERGQVPLLFVAAAGGGIKAAYWTSAGWSCVLTTTCGGPQDVTGRVFLASGVSGGSLGLAAVDARLRKPAGAVGQALRDRKDADTSWYDQALSDDFVAPSVAAFLFRDLPNSVFRLPFPGLNRAAALQHAWQQGLPALGEPFYPVVGEPRPAGPALVLNGVSAEDGCRLATATVALGPGGRCTGDLAAETLADGPRAYPARNTVDYLCLRGSDVRRNIPLSAAALLSARFPYVSPSGDLADCRGRRTQLHTYALDGGLFDNSAGTAVAQAWMEVSATVAAHNRAVGSGPCVVPRLLVLDNHYDPQAALGPAHRPQQSIAPLATFGTVYDLRSETGLGQAEQAIREGANQAVADCRGPAGWAEKPVAVVHPVQRPGSKAPLGWTLSRWSRVDMSQQLQAEENREPVERVRSWFSTASFPPAT